MNKITDKMTLIESVNAMQTHAIGCMISGIIESISTKEYVNPELKNVISEMGEFTDDLFKYIIRLNNKFNESFSKRLDSIENRLTRLESFHETDIKNYNLKKKK